jgi:hypothetical protein
MAISRFKTSSVAQGLPKYQKFWDQITALFSFSGWTARTMPSSSNWGEVTYYNDRFMCPTFTGSVVAYSTNGTSWTQANLPSNQRWCGVAYGAGLWVAIVNNNSTPTYATSADGGANWTSRSLPTAQFYNWIIYANGIFIATTNNNTTFLTSTDGLSWTTRSGGIGPQRVTWNGSMFVGTKDGVSTMQYSTDGINWTVGSMPANRSWWMPQWNGSIWVVNTYDSSNIATSPDGINWTNRTISGYTGGFDHAADPVSGIFAIPGYNQANGYTSTDGINWTTTAMPATSNYSCSAYGNGVYVAVSNGTNNAASATR